jgi:glycosyltransferase involved in cell wall biosynthesis
MKKIIFIKLGSFSHVNQKVANILREVYPKNEVLVYDVKEEIFGSKVLFLVNFIYYLWEYKVDILFGHKTVKELKSCLIVTSFFYNKVKQKVRERFTHEDILFTIQTSSQFDCSLPTVPHVVYTDHTLRANFLYPDLDYWNYLKPRKYTLELEKSVYHNANLILTYSQFIRQSLVDQYEIDTDKVEVLGVTPNTQNNTSLKIDHNKYKNKIILFVGVEWARKGGDLLLQAFYKVLQKVPDAKLQIVGSSPVIPDHPQIEVLGKIPLEKVPFYYQQATVFCMPTLREPFGVVFLEAMSYGLPVVALRRGAVRELVVHGQNGYLSRKNTDEIAKYLVALVSDPEKAKIMGEQAFNLVEENFTEKRFKERLVSAIHRRIPIKQNENGIYDLS